MKKLSQKCFSLFMVFAIMLSNFFPLFSIGRVFADADRRVQIINDVEYNGSGTFTISGGGYDGTESFSSSRSSFFEENTELTLTATPSNRYIFIGWFNCEEFEQVPGQHAWRTVGDALTTDAEYTFTVTESFYNLMPVFATGHNNIWVSGNGSIAVDYDNSEVDWQDGEDYRNGDMIDFVIGDSVTVKAQPSDGSHFVGWYVSNAEQGPDYYYSDSLVSTDEVYTYQPLVTMVAGIEDPINYLTAVFAEDSSSTRQVLQFQVWHTDGGATAIQYTIDEPNPLNLSSREELDFEPAVGAIYYGIEATVTAQPHEDYRFAGWKHVDIDYDPESVDHSEICVGEFITTTTSYTYQPGVTVLPGDEEELRYICAVFESIPTQDVHFELNGGTWEGANPITVNEGSIISRPAMNPTKDFNVFVDWFEDAELSIPFDFEHTAINTETTIYAKWSEHAYIAVGVSQSGGTWSSVELNATDMTGPMNATYNANAEVTLTANSIDGFHFVGWYEGIIGESSYVEDHTGLLYSSNPTYTTSLMNYDFSIMAVFEENNSNPPQSFTVTFKDGNDVLDSRNIVAGDYVERPNPDPFKDGFVFENWYEDFECSIPFNFNNPINGNTEIFAHFNENNNQVITFQLDAATVSGDVITFYVGDGEVTATVTGTGYSFSGNNLIVNVSDLNNVKLVLDANFTSNNMSLELHDGQVLTVTGDNEAIFDGLDFTNDNSPHLQLVDYAGGGHGQVGGPDDISFDIDLHGTYTIIEINGKEVIGDTDIFQEDYVINDLLVEEAGVADPAEFNVIKVTPRFGDNAIAACTINGVEYTLESEAVEYYDYGWFITVPGAANYVISATGDPNIATPKTIIWVNPDYVPENEEE
ncbi:InlB B-repeat-containing protein, partial [bacterium]|nr:InlB B-repeat-containing protein [bacterium]